MNKNFDGNYEVVIRHWINRTNDEYELQHPIVEDGVKWETDRQGSPGKLTFKAYKDKNGHLNFQEGDDVVLKYTRNNKDWIVIFDGVIFTKKRNKSGWIDVTAYDRLRYFKNKDTYVYTNKKASEVLKDMIDRLKLNLGTVEDTDYVIGQRAEDNQSIFDIVQNALDLTLSSTGTMYILYADNSGICLRDAVSLRTNFIVNSVVAEDFEYTSSIDDDVYNEINLYYDNDKTNKREWYVAKGNTNQNKWGVLRYTEQIQNPANVQHKVKKMLEIYNRKSRELKVSNVFGDYSCRAGASVILQLNLGDAKVDGYMLIEKATHTFSHNEYRMDLTLSGFNIDDGELNATYDEYNVIDVPVEVPSVDDRNTDFGGYYTFNFYLKTKHALTKGDVYIEYYDQHNKFNKTYISNTCNYNFTVKNNTPLHVCLGNWIAGDAIVTTDKRQPTWIMQNNTPNKNCRMYSVVESDRNNRSISIEIDPSLSQK